jgi:hypothetical protein
MSIQVPSLAGALVADTDRRMQETVARRRRRGERSRVGRFLRERFLGTARTRTWRDLDPTPVVIGNAQSRPVRLI